MKNRGNRRCQNYKKWNSRLKLWYQIHQLHGHIMYGDNYRKCMNDSSDSEEVFETYTDLKHTREGIKMKKHDLNNAAYNLKHNIRYTRKRNLANRTLSNYEKEEVEHYSHDEYLLEQLNI